MNYKNHTKEYSEAAYWTLFDVIRAVAKSSLELSGFKPADLVDIANRAIESAVREYRQKQDQENAGH